VQGVTFDLMRHYAVAELGETGWAMIMKGLGRSDREYEIGESYPDEEFAQIAGLLAQAMKKPMPYVLEAFGEAMVLEMIRVYGFLVDRRWSYIDFLLNMQPLLESAFRLDAPGASPTQKIRVQRVGPQEVSIVYESNLRACGIVRGVCRGAASHYEVMAAISDEKCVLRGDPACVIAVRGQN
jgi:heme-NO-binding protein